MASLSDQDLEMGLFCPRNYQTEMFEASLQENIIVAV